VDAVRYLSVAASGATAVRLKERLTDQGVVTDLLLGIDASPVTAAERYSDRAALETSLRRWIRANPAGVVVMSAAINDYRVRQVVVTSQEGRPEVIAPDAKLPSRAASVTIHLEPDGKVIDQLAGWGLAGPLVGFKYEDRGTVLASAASLRARVGAALVVANSLCGQLQALVDADGIERFIDRSAMVEALAGRLASLARS
jgi:phosphopantothenoylcysteine synthetase/decarboxylase